MLITTSIIGIIRQRGLELPMIGYLLFIGVGKILLGAPQSEVYGYLGAVFGGIGVYCARVVNREYKLGPYNQRRNEDGG